MPFGVIALLVSTLVARTFRGHVFAATTTVALRHHFADAIFFSAAGAGELFDAGADWVATLTAIMVDKIIT